MRQADRFKRGDIVKQENHPGGGVWDYFHVEYVHSHDSGAQGLDVIGDKDGARYGLGGDWTHPATLRELVDDREKRKKA